MFNVCQGFDSCIHPPFPNNTCLLLRYDLGAHLAKLEQADYIKIERTFVNKKPKTYLQTTGKGRDAFTNHIDALKSIIKNEQNPQID